MVNNNKLFDVIFGQDPYHDGRFDCLQTLHLNGGNNSYLRHILATYE